MKGYYFITDAGQSRAGNASDVKNALKAHVEVVQYRDKSKSTKELYQEALALRKICKDALFLINDRLDIALSVKADGVHLGWEDLPYAVARKLIGDKKIIGLTVHTLQQAIQSQRSGAQYIGVSPIFKTNTKQDAGPPVGVRLIKEIRRHVSLPVIAIGGIDLSNAKDVIDSGADGLCAISAVVAENDVKKEIEKFQRLFRQKT
ncbi:MAG: thiamine phosphate synthase [Candidatus Omnitrophota bacterium]